MWFTASAGIIRRRHTSELILAKQYDLRAAESNHVHLFSVFSLRNRALIALVTIVIGVFGGLSLTSLKQELIPSLSLPQIFIITNYPGASPAVVDSDVSTPIEAAIQGVAGLESSTSTSSANLSSVTAGFAYGTDIATAEQKVQLAINRLASLPDAATTQVLTFSFSDLPVIQIAVSSDMNADGLSAKLESSTIVDLKKVADVSDVSLLGTTAQRLVITPNQDALRERGISNQAITEALDANGVLLPAGQITENDTTLTVQAGARISSTDEIAALPLLGGNTGAVIPLSDVATVALATDPVTGISRVDGELALTMAITKTPAGNTVAVSQDVRDLIPELEKALGQNTKFTIAFDQAPFIEESINSLATEGLLGLAFAVIVILLFLLSVRSTLVTAISIPASVLITFIGMQAAGYTLNIITLGALTIAIGRVVDDSIVVIENIKRHIGLGEEKLPAILSAVKEVAGAVTASTATTVAVFLPIALVGDITGELFRPFALTVTIALAASLFVSLTIVPVLAYWFLGSKQPHKHVGAVAADGRPAGELETPTRLQKGYLPVLEFTLKRPIAVILAAVLLLGGTAALLPFMKTNFIGDSGQNTLTVSQTLPPGTSLDARDTAAGKVEEVLQGIDGVETIQLSIGSSGSSLRAAFSGTASSTFSLTTDPDADQARLQADVRAAVADIRDGGNISLTAAGSGFASSNIEVNITATSDQELRDAADAVLAAVQGLDVVAEASSNLSNDQPFIAITVDRAKAAAAGLSEIQVGGIVTAAMNPSAVGSVVIDEKTLSIYILNESAPTTIQQLRDFTIPTATGLVPLSDLATVDQQNGPASITAIRGVRSATVSVTPNGDDVGTASTVVAAALQDATLPIGADAELGGVTSQQGDAFSQLGLALLVAILIVYVVMVATFKSLRQPLLLLVSVPFAATGAIALQVISGIPLGVASLIGVLMLIGIVVTNAIVLVDLINQYRTRGMKVREAILQGASRRLRPILMTATATIFALLPLGIGLTGSGGFISQPLAIIVIGGLVSSTLLTLVVLPVLYYLVEGARERREDKRAVRAAAEPAAA
ncbi:multidrug transporter [Salinibacterium xinjiangense]|uniref:Hydrophobic/amphiphilic exporter-1, HAE1 family n=1 Tax=Salinibacterium xinjiangense TaxID=386302 RepID=A0A2C8Z403_9MICO|nr:multidrug transporter [Salinibacterium xinjiangense]SOE58389.1 hydrophobic/amphiphilic exporter-1, HAE1 family [Salinibacterium xinjiangense]